MRLELSELVGLPLDAELALARPAETAGADPAPETSTAATQLALDHNPEIEAASNQVEKARSAVSVARAEYIP